MTEPNNAPMTDVPDSVASVRALAANANRLGLTWRLRPGTVVYGPDATSVSVTLDGDVTPVNAISLVGPIGPGQRVTTMLVPPSGIYVIGFVGPSALPTVGGARATASGFIATTSGTTELALPQLTIFDAQVSINQLYTFAGTIAVNYGVMVAPRFSFYWRKGNSTTGTIVAGFTYLPVGSSLDDTKTFDASYRPLASDVSTYYLSVQRIAGTGNLNIYGTNGGGLGYQSHVRLERIGSYVSGGSFITDAA